jgi:hypothetical protein
MTATVNMNRPSGYIYSIVLSFIAMYASAAAQVPVATPTADETVRIPTEDVHTVADAFQI